MHIADETVAEHHGRIDEIGAIYKALNAQLDTDGRALVSRLDWLRCESIAAEQNRMLAIVLRLFAQMELPDHLFEQIQELCQLALEDALYV